MARTRAKVKNRRAEMEDFNHNHLRPAVSAKFEDGLEKVHNVGGKSALKLVWGCYERWFRLDRMRLKYLTGYALEKTVCQDKKTGFFYDEDYAVELGLPRHIVEVWLPPSYFGTNGLGTSFDIAVNTDKDNLYIWEENWNQHRFEFIGADPITTEQSEMEDILNRTDALNKECDKFSPTSISKALMDTVGMKLVDLIGPFPRQGEYRYFYAIENEDGTYKDPDMNDLDIVCEAYRLAYLAPKELEEKEKAIDYAQMQSERKLLDGLFNRGDLLKEAESLLNNKQFLFLGQ